MVTSMTEQVTSENHVVDIPHENVKWSTVRLSEVINKGSRFEASVFDIEAFHAREVLKECKWKLLPLYGMNGFADAYHRPRFKRVFLDKSDFPIYQPSQINDVCPKPSLFISDLTSTNIDKLRVKINQILLTCSGTVGNVGFVSKTLDNSIFSHDLIRITTKNESDTGYIYAFLKSKIGNILVSTNNYGAVIKHIEPEHLKDLLIPDPDPNIKKRIHDLVINSYLLRDESNLLIETAHKLLASELNLLPIHDLKIQYFDGKGDVRNFTVRLRDFDNRFDGSYHIPIVNTILNHLSKHAEEVTTLSDPRISTKILLPGRFKRVYVEEGQGTAFFGGKQIFELDPSSKKYLSLSFHGKRINSELKLIKNTVLVTRSGTIGKVTITPSHWENWIINEHVIRVLPANENIAGYIYAWLSSDYGYELITRFTYGAVVDEIDDKQLSEVQIPLLKNKEVQQKINGLVLEANEKRYNAYLLEQQALKVLDEEVLFAK